MPDSQAMEAVFDNVVFAGGGNRCWWQAGFWEAVAGPLPLAPSRIAGVSAGAATACMLLAGRTQETLSYYDAMTRGLRANFQPGNLFRGKRMFPHAEMYRRALLAVLDEAALARLHAGPAILVQVARLPRWLGPRAGTLVGMLAYQAEKKLRRPVHPQLGQRLGFRPEVIPVSRCATPEDLADLILASSCTPPFTPILRLHGGHVLDGGMVDNVPVGALGDASGRTLVLLSRRYGRLPQHPRRLYVQPSRPVPVKGWDYTNPQGIRAAYELGLRDGAAFLRGDRRA